MVAERAACRSCLNILAGVPTAKDGIAGNQNLGSSLHHCSYGIKSDAAIHLNTEAKMPLGPQFRKMANLSSVRRDKLLSAKARIHRHHQHIIHYVQNIGQRATGVAGLMTTPASAPSRANVLHHPVQMHAGLLVHADPAGSGIHKCRNVVVRVFDHQMNVQRRLHVLAQRGHHRRANRDVGYEVAIHHVHMQQGCPCIQHGLHLLGKAGKISRQNRWRKFDQAVLS